MRDTRCATKAGKMHKTKEARSHFAHKWSARCGNGKRWISKIQYALNEWVTILTIHLIKVWLGNAKTCGMGAKGTRVSACALVNCYMRCQRIATEEWMGAETRKGKQWHYSVHAQMTTGYFNDSNQSGITRGGNESRKQSNAGMAQRRFSEWNDTQPDAKIIFLRHQVIYHFSQT